jgi:hypothetical protein
LTKFLLKTCTLLLLSLFIGACARQNQIELTLVATQVALNTQIAGIRQTATVDADRIQITVEYMSTLVRGAEVQNEQLRATLVARGADPSSFTNIDPSFVTNLPPGGGTSNGGQQQVVITPLPGAETVGTPTTPIPGTEPTLTSIVMAEGVGSDDCALGVTTTFTTATPEIYVVATALNIQPGTTIVSRWQLGGQEIVHDFTPDFAIDQNCIWFFVDQVDTPFIAGNWNVQLEINGVAVGTVSFSITE